MKKLVIAAFLILGAGALTVTAMADGHKRGAGQALKMLGKADINADGDVTKEEIATLKAQRFSESDGDGDGVITFAEFEAYAEAQRAEREAERRQKRFEKMDADGNGTVSSEEFANAGSERGDRMFNRIDENSDGVISSEEREAMMAMMVERMERRGPGRGGR